MAPSLLPVSLRAECAKAATQFDSFANPTVSLKFHFPALFLLKLETERIGFNYTAFCTPFGSRFRYPLSRESWFRLFTEIRFWNRYRSQWRYRYWFLSSLRYRARWYRRWVIRWGRIDRIHHRA